MSVAEEKLRVVQGMKSAVERGSLWEPISSSWFVRWNQFVDATAVRVTSASDSSSATDCAFRADEAMDVDVQSQPLYPGEIDNSSLCAELEGEIKEGVVEECDYVLMPTLTADFLFSKYGGGPRFPRGVVNNGTTTSPIYQVSIHRVRVIAYHSTKLHPSPNMDEASATNGGASNGAHGSNDGVRLVKYFPRHCTFKDAIDELAKHFKIDYQYSTARCWIKDKEGPISVAAGCLNLEPRLLTQEVTCWIGPWKCISDDSYHDRTMMDVRGTKPFIELMIEDTPGKKPIETSWPRATLLSHWKHRLRVGDCFDASDSKGVWYNAVVTRIEEGLADADASEKNRDEGYDGGGKVHVHFKGWSSTFDESIGLAERNIRIKPLFSQTVDRRGWSEGDFVDVRVSSRNERAIWIAAEIVELDAANDLVKVKYSVNERDSALKKYNIVVSLDEEEAVAAARQSSKMNIDGVAQDAAVVTDDSNQASAAFASTKTATTVTADGVNFIVKWIPMLSDDICPLHTHTPRLKKPVESVRGSTGYGKGPANAIGNIGSSISSSLSAVLSKPFGNRSYVDYSEKHQKGTRSFVIFSMYWLHTRRCV